MKKLSLFTTLLLGFLTTTLAQNNAVVKAYIAQYKDIAIEEMARTGVPASITLAQGIHETDAGRSQLVQKSNNHFGIKCKTGWQGESVSHDDDARGECFRKYDNPLDSYRDHSDFLKTRAHYAPLFKLDATDYEGWAYGLKKAGYATNPKYPQILIKLINDYGLQDYTLVALGRKKMDSPETLAVLPAKAENVPVKAPETLKKGYPEGVFYINRTKVVYAPKGTSYLALAQKHGLALRRIFEFNDMVEAEETTADALVYLQRKRREGEKEYHTVAPGETLYDIAQAEGIQLESLLSYNYLRADVAPSPGRNLYLKKGDAKGGQSFFERKKEELFPAKAPSKKSTSFLLHTVQAKQSLYGIAKQYSVSEQQIIEWNNLPHTGLATGQQLRINTK